MFKILKNTAADANNTREAVSAVLQETEDVYLVKPEEKFPPGQSRGTAVPCPPASPRIQKRNVSCFLYLSLNQATTWKKQFSEGSFEGWCKIWKLPPKSSTWNTQKSSCDHMPPILSPKSLISIQPGSWQEQGSYCNPYGSWTSALKSRLHCSLAGWP